MELVKKVFTNRTFLYVIIALFCVFLVCISQDYDYDLYARLIVGEKFVEQGVFNYNDFLSYTPTHPWYDHEWGASIIFYVFFKLFGAFGLILIQALTMFITTIFIIKTQRLQKHAYPISITFLAVFLILFEHQNPSIVRCHMFSFMFFSMFIYFLEKTRKTDSNIIWLLPLITLLWNNIHGGVVSGLGIVFLYLIGQICAKKPFKKFLYVFLTSAAVLIINPYGFEYVKFLIMANTMVRKYITEWWEVFNQRHVSYYYPVFCFGIFTLFIYLSDIIKTRKVDITKLLMLLVTVYLGTLHVKLLSLPIITGSALFYNEIMHLINYKKLKYAECLVYTAIIISIFCIPLTHPLTAKTDMGKFPVKEVEFLKVNEIRGNLLSSFGLSSYISYKRFPENLIYMDGRYEEVYNDSEFNNLMHYELADENWNIVLTKYPTDILMPEKTSHIYPVIENNPDWVKIYEGPICGIFIKKKNARKSYILPSDNIEYYRKNEFLTTGNFGKKEN